MKSLFRSIFFVSAIILSAAAVFAGKAFADEKVRLHLKWNHQFQFAGYYAAIEKGFYREAGLDVELMVPEGDRDAVSAVLNGQADFGVSNSDLLIYRHNGAPVVVLGVILQHSPMSIITRTDHVKNLNDLAGKDVMMGPDAAEALGMLQKAGFPISRLNKVPVTYGIEDVISGRISAMTTYISNEAFIMEKAGVPYTEYRPIDYGLDFYGDNLFTTADMAEKKPEVVEAFRDASMKGWTYAMQNIDEMTDIIYSRYSPVHSREKLRFEADKLKSLMAYDIVELGHMNEKRWNHVADTFISLGMLEKHYSLDGFLYSPEQSDYRQYAVISFILGLMLITVTSISAYIYRQIIRLNRERRLSRHIQELGSIGEWTYDMENGEISASLTSLRLLGLSTDDAVTRSCFNSRLVPEDRRRIRESWREFKITGELDCEFRIMADEKEKWLHTRAILDRNHPSGRLTAMGYVHDVTDRITRELITAAHEKETKGLIKKIPQGIALIRIKDGMILLVNDTLRDMMNIREDETQNISIYDQKWMSHSLENRLMTAFREKVTIDSEEILTKTAKGRQLTIILNFQVIRYLDSGCGLITIQDITEKRKQEAVLKQAAAVFEVSPQAIVITDLDGTIKTVNKAFTDITGYPAEEAIGSNPSILKSGMHNNEFYKEMWTRLMTDGFWEGEIWNRKKDGSIYLEWNTITAIRDHSGSIKEFVAQFSDIAMRKLTEEELRIKNNYDSLTGLANRSLFIDQLTQMINIAKKEDVSVVIIMVELDNFKMVNEQIGYRNGDMVLQEIGRRIKNGVASTDIAARQGGDEFLVALYAEDDDTGLYVDRIKSILQDIRKPVFIEETDISIQASMGIAVYPANDAEVTELLNYAELAMYRVKEAGGNNYRFYDQSISAMANERNFIERSLSKAIVDEEFKLLMQPVINVKTRELRGAEALIRWDSVEKGIINPDLFIPIAESTGYIKIIGLWVLDEACRQLAEIKKAHSSFYTAVNVSMDQIPEAMDPDMVYSSVTSFGLKPEDFVFEITESILIEKHDDTLNWMHRMKRYGFRIALDDFGTGYSSLSYLNSFPLDYLKIDKSFIMSINDSTSNRTLVDAIISMAHRLNMQVICEGVESEEILETIKELGCEMAQGYLISKPLSSDELIKLIEEYK